MTHLYLFFIGVIFVNFIVPTSSLCSIYGVCHETAAYFNYCPADNATTVPKPLPEQSRHLEEQLRMKCPYLFADNNRDLCCDTPQVGALFQMISIATSLFSRCPSCIDNFWKYWCMYTCSPSQADYLRVLETEPSPSTNRSMVIKVQYNLSRQYAEGTYESCKDVKLASAAGNAMLIMCGRLGPNETCTLEKWLSFMGTRSAGLGVPVDILHEYHDNKKPGHFMHMNTSRCDQSPRVGQSKCMISDCPVEGKKTDFRLDEGGTQETCTLFGLGCSLYFLVFSVFIFCSVLAWAFLPYLFQQKKERLDEFDLDSSISSQAHWIPKQIHLNSVLFVEFVSKQPFLTLTTAIFLAVICCTGILFLDVTSSPIEVWVPPNSRAIQEKEYFDRHFGPFYRIQQVIMYPKPGKIASISPEIGPVFQKTFMREVFNVMNSIFALNATVSDGKRVKLEDICYRPMGAGYDCLVNSPTNFFQHNISLLDEEVFAHCSTTISPKEDEEFDYDEKESEKEEKKIYLDHLMDCIRNPYTLTTSFGRSCFAPYGGPTFPYLVFGNENGDVDRPLNSTAAIISIPFSSKADVGKMRAWEKSFVKFLKKYKHEEVQLSFLAERSIQDEIKRASESDSITVLITLLLMILYCVFALGKYKVRENRLASILVQSKIIVGFCGMLSIFTAIASSLGILAFYGHRIPSAAIVMNSFITLLIGCNRIFAVVWTSRSSLKRLGPDLPISHAFKTSLPSSLMCTMVQSTVFFTGAFISVPAVRSFCLLSSLSIILQLFFLCVLFLPICIWDLRREQTNRPEFSCFSNCISTISQKRQPEEEKPVQKSSISGTTPAGISLFSWKFVQILTILITVTILAALPWASSELSLGLDQKLAVSKDSYMYTHFTNIEKYMNIGPPVYFIVHGDVDFSQKAWQNKFCSIGGCSDSSVGGILAQASANSERSYITGETLNWLDTYLDWLAPESQCCKTTSGFSFPSNSQSYCRSNDKNCSSCDIFNADGRPSENIFYKHLDQFLEDVPSAQCVKGGRAAYHDALHLDSNGHIDASHFMTFHVPLRNSSSYIQAMTSARLLAQKMELELGENVKVFPYSVFYIFYEQFATIRTVSAYQLIFAFTAVFLATFLLTGFDALLAFIMIFVCSFQLISQTVFMVIFHIDLNSISAVNLVLAVAICVEYCLPLLTAYNDSKMKNNNLRAEKAVETVAPASFCGLTVPMIMGTGMLTFAQSPFFNVYFFRMLIVTAVSGSFSGLLLLPVLLSLFSYCKKRVKNPSVSSELREIFAEEEEVVENLHPNDPVQRAPLLTTVL